MSNGRLREQAGWKPAWDTSIRGWAVNFIRKNIWRCDGIHDFDDLLQDAYLTFMKVVNSYPRVVEPKHFMALYKTAMANEMTDRSRYKRKKDEVNVVTDVDAVELCLGRIGESTNEGYLRALVSELPEEISLALAVFADEDKLKELRSPAKKGCRENLNTKIKRVAGITAPTDILLQFKTLLGEA